MHYASTWMLTDDEDWVTALTRHIAALDDEALAEKLSNVAGVVLRVQLEYNMLTAEMMHRVRGPGGPDNEWATKTGTRN